MGTDGDPLDRLILRRTRHLECAQAVRAGQNEITGAIRARPNRDADHLREVKAIGRFSSQIVDGLQEFMVIVADPFRTSGQAWLPQEILWGLIPRRAITGMEGKRRRTTDINSNPDMRGI